MQRVSLWRGKEEAVLLRRAIVLTCALAALVAVLVACSSEDTGASGAGEEAPAVEEVVGRAAGQVGESAATAGGVAETTTEEPTMESRCYREKKDEIRIGDFEPPEEDVPEYEIIEENPVERDGAEAIRLLVDTQARSEEDYTLITRDIKSRYAELDAASIEFTDTTTSF